MTSKPDKIQKMINFIQSEAREKAEEIRVQAEEEFTLEKQKLVEDGKSKLRETFAKKENQVEVDKKIAQSNQEKEARLTVLKLRNDVVKHIMVDAEERLKTVVNDQARYKKLLTDLILQGCLQLSESKVEVAGREEDLSLLDSIVDNVQKAYKEKRNQDVSVTIAKSNFIKNSIGGVYVTGLRGRIQLDNTLEERLQLLMEKYVPVMRNELFANAGDDLY